MPPKIWVPLLVILAGISWLAFSNLSNANYFYTVDELPELGEKVYDLGLRVKGRIVAGSIESKQKPVSFTIEENGQNLKVRYIGDEPLPDMFKDHAEAVVDGRMSRSGVFEAKHLQAKCASKYEAMELTAQQAYGEDAATESSAPAEHDANAEQSKPDAAQP